MRKAYAHQKAIIKANPERAGLFLGTGTGKGFIALSLARGNILVICPKTIKEAGVWEREYREVLMRPEEWKIKSGREARIIRPCLTVMSFDEFKRDAATLPMFDTVIVDEAHGMLGVVPNTRQRLRVTIPRASQRYDALQAYLIRTKPHRFYICTATIIKSPFTVWAAKQLLKPPRSDVMSSFYDFRYEFYTRLPMAGREVYVPKTDDATKDKLAKIVHDLGFVGRLEDFFDVPAQTFKTIYVDLTDKQKQRIKEMRLEYPEPIVRIGKRHQIENGVLSGDEFSIGETFENQKVDKILDLALEFPRMVVFAKYRAQIEQIATALRKAGRKVLTLTGDTKERGAVIQEANTSKECVLIVSAQISAGWELPEYPVMIFASRTYSFVDQEQAIGRIQRANAIKKNLYLYLVVKGGVDEAVDKSLANKKDFNERLYLDI